MKRYVVVFITLLTISYGKDVDRVVLQGVAFMAGSFTQIYYDKALNEDWALRGGYSGLRGKISSDNDYDGVELGFSYEMSNPSNKIFHSYFSLTSVLGYPLGANNTSAFLVGAFLNFDFRWNVTDADAIGFGGLPGGSFSLCYEHSF